MRELKKYMQYRPKFFDLFAAFVVGVLFAVSAVPLRLEFRLAVRQLFYPVLYLDSWDFVNRGSNGILSWLLSQHNEHRIVFAKLATLLETEVLRIPPTSTFLLQSAVILTLSCGVALLIARELCSTRKAILFCWACLTAIILNPWQWLNLTWEFQTPWLLVNLLMLVVTYIWLLRSKAGGRAVCFVSLLTAALVPWLASYSSGQGIMLALAMSITAVFVARELAIVSSLSSALAIIVYFFILPYKKPANHPPLYFNIDYFATLLWGGWPGLQILCLLLLVVIIIQAQILSDRREILPKSVAWSLSLPAWFALLFCFLNTLFRSGFGIEQATFSHYVTVTECFAVSAVLAAYWLYGLISSSNTSFLSRRLFLFYPAICVLLVTALSFPQVLTGRGMLYRQACGQLNRHRNWVESNFRRAALSVAKGVGLPPQVLDEPSRKPALEYFSGRAQVPLYGWHKAPIEENKAK